MMKEIVLGIVLTVQGGIDLKNKEIPLWISVLGALAGIVFCVIEKRNISEFVVACAPGVLAILFSKFTKEAIGYGDSILLLVMGIYMTLEELISVVVLAFGIAGIVALVLLVVLRKSGRYEIAFVPFLSLAYFIFWIVMNGERVL